MRILIACFVLLAATGCATTTTQMAPVAPEAVRAEERIQRQVVLEELHKAQSRLNDIAYPMLVSAVPLCADEVKPRVGIQMGTLASYKDEWVEAAATALGLTDTLSIVSVTAGSPADRGGLIAGDRIMAINGQTVPPGARALETASKLLGSATAQHRITVRREGIQQELTAVPESTCSFGTVVTVEGDINAFADGTNVILPWAMMRFASDDELRVVVAHEIAHNAMGHIDAKRQNMLVGALFGAIADIAMASQGVNTGGEYTSSFMGLGAMTFSQDFEREADYVGMYLMARAGLPLESAPDFWRRFAQISPQAISYASSHPTTAERFVRLRQAVAEIERKRASGTELLPEMKADRQQGRYE